MVAETWSVFSTLCLIIWIFCQQSPPQVHVCSPQVHFRKQSLPRARSGLLPPHPYSSSTQSRKCATSSSIRPALTQHDPHERPSESRRLLCFEEWSGVGMGASLRALWGATFILLARLAQLCGKSGCKRMASFKKSLQILFRNSKISEIYCKIKLRCFILK